MVIKVREILVVHCMVGSRLIYMFIPFIRHIRQFNNIYVLSVTREAGHFRGIPPWNVRAHQALIGQCDGERRNQFNYIHTIALQFIKNFVVFVGDVHS
jgi:hypothetical protein